MNRFRLFRAALFCTIGVAASGVLRAQADLEKEVRKFKGDWLLESSVAGGIALPADELKGFVLTFEANGHTLKKGDEVIQVGTQDIDPSKSPKTIDVTIFEGPNKGAVMLGIYEIDGETLKVCFDSPGKEAADGVRERTGFGELRQHSQTHEEVNQSGACPRRIDHDAR